MITMENCTKENKVETCKYFLPCGICEMTKNKCTKWDITGDKYTIPPAWYQPTPINTKEWKLGDWPPGPSITCDDRVPLDMMRSSDTFRIHPESDPKYNTVNNSSYNSIDVLGNKYTTNLKNGK